MMHYVLLLLLGTSVAISGCTLNKQPATPAEQEAQEEMMRNVLQESSPRNMNEHPKVTPEFRKTFRTGGSSSGDKSQSTQDVPLTKQSEDDEESWQ